MERKQGWRRQVEYAEPAVLMPSLRILRLPMDSGNPYFICIGFFVLGIKYAEKNLSSWY